MSALLYRLADALRHRARKRNWPAGQALGRRAEDLAHRFLRRQGYTIVSRNYRLSWGAAEVDIVARDGDALVFVEVKSRESDEHGAPDRAIGKDKHLRMVHAAEVYAHRARVSWDRVRFDVVSVVFTDPPSIGLRKAAFKAEQAL